MVNFHLVTQDFGESFYVISCPCLVYFSIFPEIGFHEIEVAFDTYQDIAVRFQVDDNSAGDILLGAL